MDTNTQIEIYTGLNNLIDYSCTLNENNSYEMESLHRALLKRYFEAEQVIIDRNKNRITLELRIDKLQEETKVIDVNVNFEDFDAFLKSCINKDINSLRFYKNLLSYYHTYEPVS